MKRIKIKNQNYVKITELKSGQKMETTEKTVPKMDRKFLMGILLGLAIAAAGIYAWEARSHIADMEGAFFLTVAILYVPVTFWAIRKNSNIAFAILLVGTIAIITIYGISRSELAYLVGRDEPGGFGSLGIIIKAYQGGIIIISAWAILQNMKTSKEVRAPNTRQT